MTILAVTLSASAAACGGASDTVGEPTKQQLAGEPTNSIGDDTPPSKPEESPASDTPAPEPKAEPTPAPTPGPAAACDRDALNKELSDNHTLESALAQHERFRCLCDDQGYPLVGNINSKGTKASAFCPALKEKGLL